MTVSIVLNAQMPSIPCFQAPFETKEATVSMKETTASRIAGLLRGLRYCTFDF